MKILMGITSQKWFRLCLQNRIPFKPSTWINALKLTILSIRNSVLARDEKKQFDSRIRATQIKHPPIFILGHWRSGTTLLHKLLSLDPQFTYPNLFEVYNPDTFLTLGPKLNKRFEQMKAEKRPMDNMTLSYNDPAEDEFALSMLTLKSPLLGWVFPDKEAYFDRYLTFHEITEQERVHWKETFYYFLQKLTFKSNKQLLLKSPHHTARIKILLELFPDAKFIHIRRNPYHTFRSTVSLYEKTVPELGFGKRNLNSDTEAIINRYKIMYNSFFEEKKAIKENNLFEISFEELETDFIAGIEKIYQGLQLKGFEQYRPLLQEYLDGQKKYKKNTYKDVEENWKKQINEQWKFCFNEWNYEIIP